MTFSVETVHVTCSVAHTNGKEKLMTCHASHKLRHNLSGLALTYTVVLLVLKSADRVPQSE
jgi:hypothetical protein